MVLLPFPFLHLSQNGSEHERKFELLFARRPGGMVEKSSNPQLRQTPPRMPTWAFRSSPATYLLGDGAGNLEHPLTQGLRTSELSLRRYP